MPIQQDHFALFQLEPQFALDSKELAARYRKLQKELHPDLFSHKSASEQLRASQVSADINEAFQVLKHPVSRAKYLLEFQGFDIPEKHTIKDVEFLMLQMELREKLEAMVSAQDVDGLRSFAEEVEQLLIQLQQKLTQSFELSGETMLEQVLTYINEYQFVDKLLQEIEHEEDKLLGY